MTREPARPQPGADPVAIRVGVGGWTYEPWRGTFYPPGLPKAQELGFASRALTAIEVNGTFYRTQTPVTFHRWRAETPDGFVFALKAPAYVVNRKVLAESGPGIARFVDSGIAELGPKLGPILWQLAPARPFDEADLAAFLAMLPPRCGDLDLLHALEVRHESFVDPRFVALARRFNVAIVFADSAVHPSLADASGPFVYARLQRCAEEEPLGYAPAALDAWADRARVWAAGALPDDLPRVEPASQAGVGAARPAFLFFIAGAKVRAPLAAMALIERLRR